MDVMALIHKFELTYLEMKLQRAVKGSVIQTGKP